MLVVVGGGIVEVTTAIVDGEGVIEAEDLALVVEVIDVEVDSGVPLLFAETVVEVDDDDDNDDDASLVLSPDVLEEASEVEPDDAESPESVALEVVV